MTEWQGLVSCSFGFPFQVDLSLLDAGLSCNKESANDYCRPQYAHNDDHPHLNSVEVTAVRCVVIAVWAVSVSAVGAVVCESGGANSCVVVGVIGALNIFADLLLGTHLF